MERVQRGRRPNPGETDEDVIRQNEEFLRELKLRDKNANANTRNGAEEGGPEPEVVKKRPTIEEILKKYNIKPEEDEDEAMNQGENVQTNNQMDYTSEEAIPEPKFEDLSAADSIFRPEAFQVKERELNGPPSKVRKAAQPRKKVSQYAKSRGVTESAAPATKTSDQVPIGDSIHPLLAGMTEAEILEEQRKLIQKMDPALVEFVRSMKHKKQQVNSDQIEEPKPCSSSSMAHQTKENHLPSVPVEDLPINPEEVKTLPHMGKFEVKKLLWTVPPKPKYASVDQMPEESKNVERNARFDFQGNLLTEDEEKDAAKTWLKGLHNHGEEMERPGYTLDELLLLSRSTNAGQRAAALDTYAAILRNAHDGVFDFMLGKSVFDICSEMDWIYVVRKGLDHVDTLTVNAALNCFSGLLYPEREEVSLDTVQTWSDAEVGPFIGPDKEDTSDLMDKIQPKNQDENEDKDHQIARADLIEFLIHRSCLLERFEYLLTSKIPTSFGIINMLKILIRLSRLSPDSILKQKIIMDYLTSHYLRVRTDKVSESKRIQKMEGVPTLLLLKLLRILISSSNKNAVTLMKNYETRIFSSIEEILSCSDTLLCFIPQAELLIQQSILLWRSTMGAGVGYGVDRFLAFEPMIMKFFNLYLGKPLLNTFDLNHSALMIALLRKCVQNLERNRLEACIRLYSSLIEQLVVRCCTIMEASHLEDQVDKDASLILLHQCLEFFMFTKSAVGYQPQFTSKLDQFLCTPAFERLGGRLLKSSLLLCQPRKGQAGFEEKYPKNLVFTEAIVFGGRLAPMLRAGDFAFPFFTTLCRFASVVNLKNAPCLFNKPVQHYLGKLIGARNFYNDNNYFTKFELMYLHQVVQLKSLVGEDTCIQLAYKLCSVPRIGNEELCKQYLKIFLNSFNPQIAPEELTDLYNLYSQMIGLEKGTTKSPNQFQVWRTGILPRGWLTEPLKAVFSSLENLHATTKAQITLQYCGIASPNAGEEGPRIKDAILSFRIIVWRTLRFIRACLMKPSLQSVLVQSKSQFVDFYTKICLVFLMSPTIFLYQPIRDCLAEIFKYFCNHKILVGSQKSAVFTKSGDGSSSDEMIGFESFYSQLLTEFCNTSYGDEVFSAYILLPLRIQESYKLKTRFWTDTCMRFVRLQKENDLLPMSYFIGSQSSPSTAEFETDPDLLKVYENVLISGTCTPERNPFLYDVLKFHLKRM